MCADTLLINITNYLQYNARRTVLYYNTVLVVLKMAAHECRCNLMGNTHTERGDIVYNCSHKLNAIL